MAKLRIVLGVIVGYALSLATSIWWFHWTRHSIIDPAPRGYIIGTSIFGVLCSLLSGFLASLIAASRRAGILVAALILLASIAGLLAGWGHITLSGSWASWVSIFLMTPAAYLGAKLYRRSRTA